MNSVKLHDRFLALDRQETINSTINLLTCCIDVQVLYVRIYKSAFLYWRTSWERLLRQCHTSIRVSSRMKELFSFSANNSVKEQKVVACNFR